MLMSSLIDVVESSESNNGNEKSLYEINGVRGFTKQREITSP